MKKIILFSIVISLTLCAALFAQSPEDIFRKANVNYEDEDYGQAITFYEMLLKMDRVSAEVFYNLGNSCFKLKKIGKAIVNYERALRMAPRDRDILLNLKLARGMIVDKISVQEKGFILSSILFFYDRMNINELTVFASILYLIVMALLMFSVFLVANRRKIFYTAGTVGILFLFFTVFLAVKIHDENLIKRAIVISEKVDVRSGPKEDYLLQFSLHQGTRVRVVAERQHWFEIDLSKDLRGWLPKDSVEII